MANVKGLYFLTKESHPDLYKKQKRRFYKVNEWDTLCENAKKLDKSIDYLIVKVIETYGEAQPETQGFFIIHKHVPEPRRYYGSGNFKELQSHAANMAEWNNRCFIIGQVFAEISRTDKDVPSKSWMCQRCGNRNKNSKDKCHLCSLPKGGN